MQSKWQFVIPSDQVIPTELRIRKDNVSVTYRRCSDEFAYVFDIYNDGDKPNEEIVNEIASLMCNQSFDHGAEWRYTDIEKIDTEYLDNRYKVKFRIRDSY